MEKTSKKPGRRTRRIQLPHTQDPSASPGGAFESHLRACVARLRESVAEVLAAVGANTGVPHSITRDFGVDKSLVSKLARVMREPDPFAAALDVPGEEAMRIFSRSMRDAGAPPDALQSLHNSVASFQEMVRTHCGDRTTLEMLAASAAIGAAGAASVKQQQQLETFRKHMFRGASAVFGVQARAQVAADFISPTRRDDERYDVTQVNGLVELRRIRSDVIWAVSSMRTIEDSRRPGPILPFEPLDPESVAANGGVPLIREFCSSPIPELRATDTNENVRRFELPEGSVGSTSAVTLFTGWTYRNASLRRRTDDEPLREHLLSLSTPAEFLLSDLFVHKDLAFARRASAHLYSQLPGAISYPNGPRSRGLLPMLEPIQDLSGCPVHPTTSEVSQYGRLVQKVIRRLGFSVNDFYGLRILLRYPPIPAMLVYRYELPEAP